MPQSLNTLPCNLQPTPPTSSNTPGASPVPSTTSLCAQAHSTQHLPPRHSPPAAPHGPQDVPRPEASPAGCHSAAQHKRSPLSRSLIHGRARGPPCLCSTKPSGGAPRLAPAALPFPPFNPPPPSPTSAATAQQQQGPQGPTPPLPTPPPPRACQLASSWGVRFGEILAELRHVSSHRSVPSVSRHPSLSVP